ncbi:hypothetical protein [Streptacidiphilus neutrinimicus]|uniref:hypothetical protein n=1 Tax=Streptacidiphilus neutrinimicus TaxID=105420 RepID=UPI0005A940CB|nr:hypothetical protein [Streptacidiphilus neutrinimicus]
MAGQTLSPRERRILAALESDLRQEKALDRALRTMAAPDRGLWGRLLERCARVQLDWMVLLVASGLALATVAVEVRTTAVTASTAGFWAAVALLEAARVAGRRRRNARGQ